MWDGRSGRPDQCNVPTMVTHHYCKVPAMSGTERALEVIRCLERAYPDAPATYLDHRNAFEMLIATILSAHTADAAVNKVTPLLFEKYPTPAALATADLEEVKQIVRPCGTYNRKATYIVEVARILTQEYAGEVPSEMDALVRLPGVSRKTANVVLSVVFGKNEGVVVDTHVRRVTQRLGLTAETSPQKIERDLMAALPRDLWDDYARLVGAHGRRVCKARKPLCGQCAVLHLCPYGQSSGQAKEPNTAQD